MRFVDRSEEMRRLQALAARREGGLAVVWGRRRVGKTRLLLEWTRKRKGLYTVADMSAGDIQRRYLAQTVASRIPGFDEVSYPDWRSFFDRLARESSAHKWRGPLVLDEIPYLIASSPELPSVIQQWIDHEAKRSRLVIAVAGSSQRMMQGLVMDSSAPLYGRATELLKLEPIAPGYLGKALTLSDPVACVSAHAVWGGIPYYWELASPFGKSLDRAVDACALDPLSPLHGEPDRLLLEDLPPAVVLRPILDAIGMGVHRANEIAARLGQPATSLARPLGRLVDLGLVRRELPFGESEKSSKRSLYRIADPFFRFWFTVVAPHRALLAQAPAPVRLDLWRKSKQRVFSETWEELCRQSVSRLGVGDHGTSSSRPATVLARYGPWLPAGRYWHGKGPEWDVVSLSTDGNRLLLGEVKWTDGPASDVVVRRAISDLIRKGIPPVERPRSCEIVHVVFFPRIKGSKKDFAEATVIDADDVLADWM
jgi:AAA+ ATPase superfamily predicted ATPase